MCVCVCVCVCVGGGHGYSSELDIGEGGRQGPGWEGGLDLEAGWDPWICVGPDSAPIKWCWHWGSGDRVKQSGGGGRGMLS